MRVTAPLHVVTDDEVVARRDFVALCRGVCEAGGMHVVLHLRGPRTAARRLYDVARVIHPFASAEGVRLVVNDRVDVAAASADGVQVGARGLPVPDARRVMGPGRRVGASVHSVDEGRRAAEDGADWLFAGTIWATPSHPGREAAGLGLVRRMAALKVPVIVIGGVTPERAAEARAAGAAGVAVIRGVWDAPDPRAAVREYLEHWKGTDG